MNKDANLKSVGSWALFTVLSYLVLLTATILAYLRLVPLEIKKIPYYDKIGHFMLFGTFAFLLDRALRQKNLKLGRISVSLAVVLVALYAAFDEVLQGFSLARSLDMTDFLSSFIGIASLVFLGRIFLESRDE